MPDPAQERFFADRLLSLRTYFHFESHLDLLSGDRLKRIAQFRVG